jgi:hypothetical protein
LGDTLRIDGLIGERGHGSVGAIGSMQGFSHV